MPPGSRYGRSPARKEKVFVDFYAEIDKQVKRRKTTASRSETMLMITPGLSAAITVAGAALIWDGSQFNLNLETATLGFILIVLAAMLVIANISTFIWGRVKPSEKSIAKKIFTPNNFKTCDAGAVWNFTLVSSVVQEAIKRNLKITEEHIKYMNLLVSDGYQGSFYDLCETVKKL
jgi:hypothetical protein